MEQEALEDRTILVLAGHYDAYRVYMERQYGRVPESSTGRTVTLNRITYRYVDAPEYARGYPTDTTVIVLRGGRNSPAWRAVSSRYDDIRYRETLP